MPVKLYFTTGISNWLCVNSDSVDTQQPITRARGVWVSLLRARLTCKEVIHETPTYLTTNTLLSAGYSFHVTDLTVPLVPGLQY